MSAKRTSAPSGPSSDTRRAVFLDRDGTIIEDCGYIRDPKDVRLLPRASEAVRRYRELGYLVVIVSNQSGVARGLFDESVLSSVHDRLEALLEADGAQLDGAYYCPYLAGPDATIEAYRRDSDLRKPRPGMLLQAAGELGIDLTASWMIGDSRCDVEAGKAAGCRTVLVGQKLGTSEIRDVAPTHRADDLHEALAIVEEAMKQRTDQSKEQVGASNDDRVLRALDRIHDQLERAQRDRRQHDFSVLRLFGALLQMFAVVAVLWGVAALVDDRAAGATARIGLACFLQLASLTAWAIDRFR